MDLLSINDKPRYFIRFGIGFIFIISGIANFISNYTDVHLKDVLLLALFVLAGIANMTMTLESAGYILKLLMKPLLSNSITK